APTGRNRLIRIAPLQGSASVARSFRRALPHAIDYRAFSPVAGITGTGITDAEISDAEITDAEITGTRRNLIPTRDFAYNASTAGPKARNSLARGNAPGHGWYRPIPEAPTGRNPYCQHKKSIDYATIII
ncbi:MAG: hypothetical protein LBB64_03070, partial [Dysgonamonadaceae bacterium]|nr:hypothetical protein [Dysgonamonadaceae bacterium]